MNTKISKAIRKALSLIEKQAESLNKGETEVDVWHAASEVEYALFLFSMLRGDEKQPSAPKATRGPHGVIELLKSAEDALRRCEEELVENKYPPAHQEAFVARRLLLKIHEVNEKKRGR